MGNRLLSAIALIGLMLFSTLGTLAFSPSLSKTEYGYSVSKTSVTSAAIDMVFLKPDEPWTSPQTERYQESKDHGKYDNRPINGILNQEDRKKRKALKTL